MISQEPLFETLSMKDMEAPQFADLFRPFHLFQANGAGCFLVSHSGKTTTIAIRGMDVRPYQTNWLSTASDRPKVPFVVVHHCSKVRVGETASRLRRRSSGFFFDCKNAWRPRRLRTIVNLALSASSLCKPAGGHNP